MKMRKRIAALIVAAMVASLMPMTTFAASKNRVTNTVVAKKNQELDLATAPKLRIELEDELAKGLEFYLELENAEWAKESEFTTGGAITTPDISVRRINSTTLAVKADENQSGDILIPLLAKLTGGEATVTIDNRDTVVTAGKYVFATSSDSKAKAKVGSIPAFADSVEIAKLSFEESYIGAFKADEDKTIVVELNDKNFKFTDGGKLKATKSFTTGDKAGTIVNDQKIRYAVSEGDYEAIQRGALEISGIKILANNKASEGDVEVYIDGYFFEDTNLVVAKFGDYETSLKTKEVKEFTAGRDETVEFTLAEVAKGAINKNRATTFTFSKGIDIREVRVNDNLITGVKDTDDKNVFTLPEFDGDTDLNADNEAKFKVKVNIPAKFEGDLVVKAEGRSLEENKEVTLAEVVAPVKIKVAPMKIQVGTKDNAGGKITITETDKKMINRGLLVIQLPQDLQRDGVEFTNVKDLDLKTTGGIKVDKAKYNSDKGAIEIEVTRQSTEAGSVEVSGFEVKARRTIADGNYEIEIGGTAISKIADLDHKDEGTADEDRAKYENIDAITAVDFLLVGEDFTKAEVKFVIGSSKFLVDGKEMTMDAAAYIKDGRTMVPLRYLSVAIGIDEEAIKFGGGVITIIDGMRIIQLQNGSKDLVVNGMTIPMSAAAEIVDGRTYVPVSEIGAVFNVAGTWDPATQTATFK